MTVHTDACEVTFTDFTKKHFEFRYDDEGEGGVEVAITETERDTFPVVPDLERQDFASWCSGWLRHRYDGVLMVHRTVQL